MYRARPDSRLVILCIVYLLGLAACSHGLVVLTDLKSAELTPALAEEIWRVLHPWYGMAVLGDVSGKLAASNLTEWAKTIGLDASGFDSFSVKIWWPKRTT